jgi:hypothetical protein
MRTVTEIERKIDEIIEKQSLYPQSSLEYQSMEEQIHLLIWVLNEW